jgi:anti-anti-sigma factor
MSRRFGAKVHLDIQHLNDYTLVRFGQICSLNHTNTEEFQQQVLNSTESGKTVIMDLDNLEFIDSAGLTLLIYLRKEILQKGGQLKLANVGKRILKLLQITRLHRVIEIFGSIEEAVKSLNIRREGPSGDHPYKLHVQVKHTDHFSLMKIKQPDALISANSEQFKRKVLQYLKSQETLIIDFDHVRNVDSTGIASLIDLKEFAKTNTRRIILVYENETLTRLFRLYSIDDLFPWFHDNNQAVAALKLPDKKPTSSPEQNMSSQNLDQSPTIMEEEFGDLQFLEIRQK